MKINNFKKKIVDCVIIGAVVLLFYICDVPCLFKAVFHIPCPGCGMTRAYIRLLQLDVKGAFLLHPMFWSVPLVAALYFTDGKLFRVRWLNVLVYVLLFGGFVAQWICKLI